MKQGTFKKLLLIATFAVITIASASLNYCFGEESCNIPTTNPEVDVCEMCGNRQLIGKCEIWHDGVDFHIHTYECWICGFWYVLYN